MIELIMIPSIVIQLSSAAVAAFIFVKEWKNRAAGFSGLAIVFLLMGIRRIASYIDYKYLSVEFNITTEVVALLISLLLLASIISVYQYDKSRREALSDLRVIPKAVKERINGKKA